jgi:hypothetical protein
MLNKTSINQRRLKNTKGERSIAKGNASNEMITVYTSNSTLELAEVKFNTCMFIDYNGNEYIIVDYFKEKKLYKLRHDDNEKLGLIYIDTVTKIDNITKIDLEKKRARICTMPEKPIIFSKETG